MGSNAEAPIASRTEYRYSSYYGLLHYIFAENGISVVNIASLPTSRVAFVITFVIMVALVIANLVASPRMPGNIFINFVLNFGTGVGIYAIVYVILTPIANARSRAMLKKLTLEDLVRAGKVSSLIEWSKVANAESKGLLRGRLLTIFWSGKTIVAHIIGAESTDFLAFLSSKLGNRFVVKD